ncbi:hypothetical protein [Marinomonas transparens]|uniref:Lipoprotein n=1 Tax=Marinomonas transparens TaxID=2795388 RepID=A0A934JS90_9GAMM|nr:hypothetical protein [Marinomonas transparens]MBJ7537351.1 hypothetical protein [Marinomonas transparens]
MSLFRSGLWLATLILSACSLPMVQNSQTKQDIAISKEAAVPNDLAVSSKVVADKKVEPDTPLVAPNVSLDLLKKRDSQRLLANQHYMELKQRIGDAFKPPKQQTTASTGTDKAVEQLESYNNKASAEIDALNARVAERRNMALRGDLIQIFLSDTKISHSNTQFNAQPLVGQWIRGESRDIRLKDKLLFESTQSEDLNITYSESYQLLINGQAIASINPKKDKNSATFDVQTKEKPGTVAGKLDYRVINKK